MGKKRKEKEGDKDREETDERETPSKKSKIEEDKVEEEGGRSAYSASASQKISVLSCMFVFNCRSNVLCHSTITRTCHLNLFIQILLHSNVLFIRTCLIQMWSSLNDDFSQM